MQIQKHTLNLRKGDWDQITRVYGPKGIATAVVVRQLISRFVDRVLEDAVTDEELRSIKGDL